MNKEVKKLCRMLDAAGIAYKSHEEGICVSYFWIPSCRIKKEGAREKFNFAKRNVDFKGNDWDGLKKRLEESEDWDNIFGFFEIADYKSKTYTRTGIDFRKGYTQFWDDKKGKWQSIKPHQIWKFLDKVDKAKVKGGKQTIKFKGCKYEFDFPVVEDEKETKIKVPFTANQLTGQAYKDEEHLKILDSVKAACNQVLKSQERKIVSSNISDFTEIKGFKEGGIQTETSEHSKSVCENFSKGLAKWREDTDDTNGLVDNECNNDSIYLSHSEYIAKVIEDMIIKQLEINPQEIKSEDDIKQEEWRKVTDWDSIVETEKSGYFITSRGVFNSVVSGKDIHKFATEKQAQQILAFAMLTQIHKAMMDATDEKDWELFTRSDIPYKAKKVYTFSFLDIGDFDWFTMRWENELECTPFQIVFYTEEQRNHFTKHNKELINQYLGK